MSHHFERVLMNIVGDRLQHPTPNQTHVSGTFEAFTLFDLLVTLTQKPEPRRLYVLIGDEEAIIVTQERRLVAAGYRGQVGKDALMAIFSALEDDPNAEFVLEPAGSHGLDPHAWTITTPLDQLLLEVASMLDRQRARKKPLVSAKATRTHVRTAAEPEPAPARWLRKLLSPLR